MMIEWGDLPAVHLALPNGASATITLYGAHLVSWKSAGGQERLFCSARSARDGKRAIRGGVPVIFPQFAERGDGMRHGFARVSTWRLEHSGGGGDNAFARFVLEPGDLATPWTHDFLLRLTVTLRSDSLVMALDVINNGDSSFAFSAALHSYYLVDDLANARVIGVQDEALAIGDSLDQIFYGVGSSLALQSRSAPTDDGDSLTSGSSSLVDDGNSLAMTQSGFVDAVVWNPGAKDAAAMPDMEDGEYRRFLCVEPALIAPLTLAPAKSWRGELVLSSIL
jgi:glucose-6-phosphate 1-epimerase